MGVLAPFSLSIAIIAPFLFLLLWLTVIEMRDRKRREGKKPEVERLRCKADEVDEHEGKVGGWEDKKDGGMRKR